MASYEQERDLVSRSGKTIREGITSLEEIRQAGRDKA